MTTTPDVVSLAAFSRMHGVSRKTASTWKRNGFLVMSEDGGVVVHPSNEKLSRRARTYRGGKVKDASTNVGVGDTVLLTESARLHRSGAVKDRSAKVGADGTFLLTKDEWDDVLIREALARLLAIGIERCDVRTLCAVCDRILAEWRGEAEPLKGEA